MSKNIYSMEPPFQIKLTIIIVLWKSADFIMDCLNSILMQSFKNFELLLVDNNVDDKDRNIVSQILDNRIIYLSAGKNQGFAAGQNMGIRHAIGTWVFCLNSDTILPPSYLESMNNIMLTSASNVGMLGSRVLSQSNANVIDSDAIAMTRHRFFYDVNAGKKISETMPIAVNTFLGICACGVFYRKTMIDEISIENEFFDEDFFCFYEDVDVCWRILSSGWKFKIYHELFFFHKRHGASSNDSIRILKKLTFRNRYWVIIKNDTFTTFFRDLKYIALMEMINVFKVLYYPYLWIAYFEMISKIPRMLKKKSSINKLRKVKTFTTLNGDAFKKNYIKKKY